MIRPMSPVCRRIYADGEPGAIIALPFPRPCGDSTGGHLGVAVGVVSADCLEFKVRRAQAHPFLRQSTLARWASS